MFRKILIGAGIDPLRGSHTFHVKGDGVVASVRLSGSNVYEGYSSSKKK